MVRGVLFSVLLLCAMSANGLAAQTSPVSRPYAQEYGTSLPPMGYVAFCARGEAECKAKASTHERVKLTPQIWDMVSAVNLSVNTHVIPMSDEEQYGVPDYWTYPVKAGDCEDYALEKKRELVALGVAPRDLLMTVVLDENGEGHAILTVATDKGDYMLDNRRNEILRWDQTHYKFLKRQSQLDPMQWVSLKPNSEQVLVSSQTTK
ncbi:MAG: transglutaminase-like cysteine peptidase [Aestuariivirga sp.]